MGLSNTAIIRTYIAATPLVSCYTMRFFWVSWAANRIQIGTGTTVGLGRFLNKANPGPVYPFNYFGIASSTAANTAIWQFPDNYFAGAHI